MAPSSKTRKCERCGQEVTIAQFNGTLVDHRCPHGRGCGLFYNSCPDCLGGAPRSCPDPALAPPTEPGPTTAKKPSAEPPVAQGSLFGTDKWGKPW